MKKPPRGYLLAEAMVAGAILASAIGITFSFIADSKSGQIYANHRSRAVDVARTKLEELATATVCTPASASFTQGPYSGTFAVADAGGTSTPPIVSGDLCSATVSVDYPAADRSSEDQTDGTVNNHKGRVTFTRMWARNIL